MEKKNAISLIVLVITIIILSILAATVIITLSNTNIIEQANESVNKTEAQQIEETKILMQADGMLGKNPESITIGDTTLVWDATNKKVIEKKKPLIKEGVTIPAGFYYVGGTKDTGLVISDNAADENKGADYTCVGNQFVWIPVEDYSKFVRGNAVITDTSGSGICKMTGTLSSSYTEPYASGYSDGKGTEEKAEYDKMMLSVEKNKGFYIARFEAGDGEATAQRTKVTAAHTVVSKKDAYVYNYVPWGKSMSDTSSQTKNSVANVAGAVELSKNMYKDSTSVVSTLCYGVQWDAAMNFVSDAEHNIKDSRSWGNYSNSEGDAATNSGSSNMNYTTGRNEAWKAKNIYDLAGNVYEWTMESLSSGCRVSRGGYYGDDGSDYPASSRNSLIPADAGSYLGFRATLYIQ